MGSLVHSFCLFFFSHRVSHGIQRIHTVSPIVFRHPLSSYFCFFCFFCFLFLFSLLPFRHLPLFSFVFNLIDAFTMEGAAGEFSFVTRSGVVSINIDHDPFEHILNFLLAENLDPDKWRRIALEYYARGRVTEFETLVTRALADGMPTTSTPFPPHSLSFPSSFFLFSLSISPYSPS
jgi:hypothetical protein